MLFSDRYVHILSPGLFTAFNKSFTLYMSISHYLPASFVFIDSPFYSHAVFVSFQISQKKPPILSRTGIALQMLRSCKIAKNYFHLRHICLYSRTSIPPFVSIEQLCSHWADFHKILYFDVFFMSRKFKLH